jgi:hypothetical protein
METRAGRRGSDVESPPSTPIYGQQAPIGSAATGKGVTKMKYIILIHNNPATYEAWPEAKRNELFGEVDTIMKELQESGEWVGGQALADASQTKTVRVRDDVPATTDGPYAEAKEQLAGYLIVDTESIERAVEIAARWPDAKHFAMEVRPIIHTSGAEM